MSIYSHRPRFEDALLSRRQMLQRCGMGMGSLGLAGLLGSSGLLTATARGQDAASVPAVTDPLAPKLPPFRARAKRVIHIFCNGGPSHVDLFDPKPELAKYAGKPLPAGRSLRTEVKTGGAFPTPFKFNRYGQSGLELSELLPTIAKNADELCVIRSMKAEVPNHEPSLMM